AKTYYGYLPLPHRHPICPKKMGDLQPRYQTALRNRLPCAWDFVWYRPNVSGHCHTRVETYSLPPAPKCYHWLPAHKVRNWDRQLLSRLLLEESRTHMWDRKFAPPVYSW